MYFNVSWAAADGGSGLSHYDVQYKVGPLGAWQGWLTNTLETSAPFLGVLEQTYYFKVSATDKVNNTDAEEVGPVTVKGVTKYYTLGSQRVAMRQGNQVYYLHGDHLGSTSLTTDQSGAVVAQTRYLPYGQERWTSGATPTDFTFTGQRNEAGFGLMDYNARYYSPYLSRFISPDPIVPNAIDPQSFNRYTYVLNNPVRLTDPSGHICVPCALGIALVVAGIYFYNEMPVGEGAPAHTPVRNYVESGADVVGDAVVLYNEYPKNVPVNTLAMALPFVSGPMLRGLRHVISDGILRYGDEAIELGQWMSKNRRSGIKTMTEAMEYQSQVTGAAPGWEFVRNGIAFDGVATLPDGSPVLLDAKFWRSGRKTLIDHIGKEWGQDAIIGEARRQLNAADGIPIQWHVVDEGAANKLVQFFEQNSIDIEVIHTPQ